MEELLEIRDSIVAGRYEEAIALVDELEAMSQQAILGNIQSFVVRLLVHLIKDREEPSTNSWVASISNSLLPIQSLNLKAKGRAFYI